MLVPHPFFPDHSGVLHRRLLRFSAAALLLCCAAVLALNLWVVRSTASLVYTDIAAAPSLQAALVLGSRVYPSGQVSRILADRLDGAIELYQQKKVQKLLVSGDHGTQGYDEANAMRNYLRKRGIPAEDIFMDHAGFDTYDSVYRAKYVFQAQSVIIVSQAFHVPRALMIARALSLHAIGVPADRHAYPRAWMLRIDLRESLARVKAFFDILTSAQPRYLGEAIPLTGDGRVTEDAAGHEFDRFINE